MMPWPDPPPVQTLPVLGSGNFVEQALQTAPDAVCGFESRGVKFIVRKLEPFVLEVLTASDCYTYLQHIEVNRALQGSVLRSYLYCPVLQVPCRTLYFYSSFWASREGHKLGYGDASSRSGFNLETIRLRLTGSEEGGRSRGRNREKVLDQARQVLKRGILPRSWYGLEPVINAAVRDQRVQARRSQRRNQSEAASLEWAIAHGQAATEEWPQGALGAPGPEMLAREAAGHPPRELRVLEGHASLDLACLRARGWLKPGSLTRWWLGWGKPLTDGAEAILIVDARDAVPSIRVQLMGGKWLRPVEQTMKVVERERMPGRLFLQCPVSGESVLKLYLRDGFFASAKSQRLTYRCKVAN
jgi:hypothetical protein